MSLDIRVWGIALLALVLACTGSYFAGRADGRKVERAEAQIDVDQWKDNADIAYGMYLKARDQKEIQYRTITKTVEAAKNATPDIADCRTGDDWMRIYRANAAIANGTAVPASPGDADRPDAGGPAPVRP